MKIKIKPPDARQLIKEIEAHLPLPVYATSSSASVGIHRISRAEVLARLYEMRQGLRGSEARDP